MHSIRLVAGICLLFSCLLGFSQSTTSVMFDYKYKTGSKTVPYNQEIEVVLTDVNTLDYAYEVTFEAITPKPAAMPGGFPGFPKPFTEFAPDCSAQVDSANEKLLARLKVFGDGLDVWLQDFNGVIACDEIKTAVLKQLKSANIKDHGQLKLDSSELVNFLTKTSHGGALKIEVQATPKKSVVVPDAPANDGNDQEMARLEREIFSLRREVWKINNVLESEAEDEGNFDLVAEEQNSNDDNTVTSSGTQEEEPVVVDVESIPLSYRVEQKDLNDAEKTDSIKGHLEKRVFKLEFERPSGIDFSFGPYISFMGQKTFAKQKKEPGSEELVIGLEKDDDIRYGVAAYWHVPVSSMERWAATWGVAYTTQGDLDDQIQGLLGLSYRPFMRKVYLNFGVSVGNQKKLAKNFELNTSVLEADDEIPVTTKLGVSGFVGLSYSF